LAKSGNVILSTCSVVGFDKGLQGKVLDAMRGSGVSEKWKEVVLGGLDLLFCSEFLVKTQNTTHWNLKNLSKKG